MDQKEFLTRLEERVRALDKTIQAANDEIGKIKGIIIDYEFNHRDEA